VIEDYLAGGMPALVRAVCAPLGSDGHSLAEKVWEYADKGRLQGKVVCAALKAKDADPQSPTGTARLEGDRFGTVTGVTALREPGQPVFPVTDFVYSRYLTVFDEPLGEAAFRPAYGPYWMRDTVRKLRAIHTEKKMAGMLVGEYEPDDDKAPLEAALAAAKASTWMSVPAGTRVQAVQLSTAIGAGLQVVRRVVAGRDRHGDLLRDVADAHVGGRGGRAGQQSGAESHERLGSVAADVPRHAGREHATDPGPD